MCTDGILISVEVEILLKSEVVKEINGLPSGGFYFKLKCKICI